jgi:ABC-type antimicrobial peptide transport system permease subunit
MFGLLAFHVARRTNELGVRMALGASRASLMRLVLRDVALMALAGVVIGAGAALTVTGLVRSILFGFKPDDPVAFLVAGGVLTIAALAAGWLPARRAARVDPLIALRHE